MYPLNLKKSIALLKCITTRCLACLFLTKNSCFFIKIKILQPNLNIVILFIIIIFIHCRHHKTGLMYYVKTYKINTYVLTKRTAPSLPIMPIETLKFV